MIYKRQLTKAEIEEFLDLQYEESLAFYRMFGFFLFSLLVLLVVSCVAWSMV